MPSITNATRLAAVLSFAIFLRSPIPAASAPAHMLWPEPMVLPTETPVSTSRLEDRATLGTSRLAMPPGAVWETAVAAGSFTLHVETGTLGLSLDAGEATVHLLSAPLRDEQGQTIRAADEVTLRADDWITADANAVLAVSNRSTQPASAILFRVIPLHPPVAPADLPLV